MTEQPSPNRFGREEVFSILGALGAIITLIAAVMFYFGWRRSDAQARAMSIDVSLFGFSSQDYVLRSISSLYIPLLIAIGLTLLWVRAHRSLEHLIRSDWLHQAKHRAAVANAARIVFLAGAGLAAGCVLFSALAGREAAPWPIEPMADVLGDREWVLPLVLVVSALLAAYAAWVRSQLSEPPPSEPTLWRAVLPVALVTATVVLGGFWLLEEYAASVGRDYAEDVAAGIDRLPHAVVTSATPLGLQAPGVVEQLVTGTGGTPRYRTSGLRLLARSGGKVLLLHDGWTSASGTVIVLGDTVDMAWEFSR